jgi:cation transport regulator
MPYAHTSDLPQSVQANLPDHAQEIYKEAFNHAWDEYKSAGSRREGRSQEETAHAVAWSAVEKSYKKNSKGNWVAKK